MPINERERPNGEETGEPLTRRKAVSLLHRLGQASVCARRWARARLGRTASVIANICWVSRCGGKPGSDSG
jgi:hypothetical protein